MKKIRVGGVPEHFNMPWHWAIQKGLFRDKGIELEWTDFPGGTGAMNKALKDNDLDVAILLTEGAVADIIKGNPSKICSWYVKSPLVWGIHVAASSDLHSIKEIEGKRYAISRMGSGSHLMAIVYAAQRKFEISNDQFIFVNNLDGAVAALTNGEADVFMWEKFMTKPFVDNGIFRMLGECPTPWPSFVIVVRNDFLSVNHLEIKEMIAVILNAAQDFRDLPNVVNLLSERYHLQQQDVSQWLSTIEWANDFHIDQSIMENVIATLVNVGIIESFKSDIPLINSF